MGPLKDLLGMIPGINQKAIAGLDIDDKQIVHIEAILSSMTDEERKNPEMINVSRRERIAKGSGQSPVVVNRLLKQFKDSKKMMKRLAKLQKSNKKNPFGRFFK